MIKRYCTTTLIWQGMPRVRARKHKIVAKNYCIGKNPIIRVHILYDNLCTGSLCCHYNCNGWMDVLDK